MREGSGVQRGAIGGGVFRSFALEYNPISHYESSNFFLSIFIDEDEGVKVQYLKVRLALKV